MKLKELKYILKQTILMWTSYIVIVREKKNSSMKHKVFGFIGQRPRFSVQNVPSFSLNIIKTFNI